MKKNREKILDELGKQVKKNKEFFDMSDNAFFVKTEECPIKEGRRKFLKGVYSTVSEEVKIKR